MYICTTQSKYYLLCLSPEILLHKEIKLFDQTFLFYWNKNTPIIVVNIIDNIIDEMWIRIDIICIYYTNIFKRNKYRNMLFWHSYTVVCRHWLMLIYCKVRCQFVHVCVRFIGGVPYILMLGGNGKKHSEKYYIFSKEDCLWPSSNPEHKNQQNSRHNSSRSRRWWVPQNP